MLPMRIFMRNMFVSKVFSSEINLSPTNFNTIENCGNLLVSEKRKLKVAILGAPNAGKSTLINKIVGHPVLCVSKKVHTTRKSERAAVVRNNAQIMFVDTPGLVLPAELKRFQLDASFREDAIKAIKEAHIVGVIHDAANTWTRHRFDRNILKILNDIGSKEVFLVLNKIDAVKPKQKLLDLVHNLTTNDVPKEGDEKPRSRGTWSNFSEVFMVSALEGNGVSDLLDFLLSRANEGNWFLPHGEITDRSWPEVLQELVRGRLLDALPQEVPYSLRIETEYFHINELQEVVSVVLVTCPILRHQKIILGGGGRIIRQVAKLAEEDARDVLRTHVRLRIVVTSEEDKRSQKPYQ